MIIKVCNKCNVEKPLDEFYLEKRNKSGVMGSCKECYNFKQKEWRFDNCEILKEREKKRRELYYDNIKKSSQKYYINNINKVNKRNREWRKNNPDISKESSRKWKINNTDKTKEYNQLPEIKMSHNMRCRIKQYLKTKNITKKNKTFDIVGCSPQLLKEYLEKQFTQGMSWDNYGEWHIDHIVPLSSAKSEDEIYKLCYYSNLQPLWAEDNLRKSDKIIN